MNVLIDLNVLLDVIQLVARRADKLHAIRRMINQPSHQQAIPALRSANPSLHPLSNLSDKSLFQPVDEMSNTANRQPVPPSHV